MSKNGSHNLKTRAIDCGWNYVLYDEVQSGKSGVLQVNKLAYRLAVIAVVLMGFQPAAGNTQGLEYVADELVGSPSLQILMQADKVYERGDYERAMFIYKNELAPVGDKFGQYMIGFMYLTGKGVAADPITASAWYRLAAERGTKEFVREAQAFVAAMNAEQKELSDRSFIALRRQYSDIALLTKAAKADYESLRSRTRAPTDTASLSIIGPSSRPSGRDSAEYYLEVEKRMRARLKFIADKTGMDIDEIDYERIDWPQIEKRVDDYLSKLN